MPNAVAIIGDKNGVYAKVDANGNLLVSPSSSSSVTNVQNSGTPATTQVSVGVTSTDVLPANTSRKYLCLVNDGASTIYVNFGENAALNAGVRLNANGGTIIFEGTYIPTSTVKAISALAGQNLAVIEG